MPVPPNSVLVLARTRSPIELGLWPQRMAATSPLMVMLWSCKNTEDRHFLVRRSGMRSYHPTSSNEELSTPLPRCQSQKSPTPNAPGRRLGLERLLKGT